jgi:hypothetical protein
MLLFIRSGTLQFERVVEADQPCYLNLELEKLYLIKQLNLRVERRKTLWMGNHIAAADVAGSAGAQVGRSCWIAYARK